MNNRVRQSPHAIKHVTLTFYSDQYDRCKVNAGRRGLRQTSIRVGMVEANLSGRIKWAAFGN
jgi:hypothetical protein